MKSLSGTGCALKRIMGVAAVIIASSAATPPACTMANATKGHRATGMIADGGFAEYVLHHVSALYKIPLQVSFKDAVLLTTAGTGLYGLDAAGGYIVGYDIAIFGPGPVGLMTVQACKELGLAASSWWGHGPVVWKWANALAPTTSLIRVSATGRHDSGAD